ncbi:RNA recognition motif domain [Dillenia turbinata]|uniref:RNA recognition motif domain n=1 Tax=Dillenia turbinata TaxID=194707 RepID=A0AAN8W6D9_9MAGN
MGDYWNRQQPLHPSAGLLKRPRTEYDLPPSGLPSGYEMHNYLSRDDDHGGSRIVKDTKTIGSAYDRYLQTSQVSSLTSGEASSYGVGLERAVAGLSSAPINSASLLGPSRHGAAASDLAPNGRGMGYRDQLPVEPVARPVRETVPLPPDASSTIYVEGLPPDSTRREVAHIFRPFVGYKEVRLVTKESKHRGGDPLILCFVDFANPACYKMDEHDRDSAYLRLQFSRYPGPRSSGSGGRGRR